MQAVVQSHYGFIDQLSIRDVPQPDLGPHDVLIETRAAAIDRGTLRLLRGHPLVMRAYSGVRKLRFPIPGRDIAGIVRAIGADVTRFVVGDDVVGTADGALAELAVTAESRLVRKPQQLSWQHAAILPISAVTAWQAIDRANVESGDAVLILGASGGVGSYAVQFAVAQGAVVTAAASQAKHDFVRSLGAQNVIDYTIDDGLSSSQSWSAIISIGGTHSVRTLRHATAHRGALVIVGSDTPGSWFGVVKPLLGAVLTNPFVTQQVIPLTATEESDAIQHVVDAAAKGLITPPLDRTFALNDYAAAFRYLDDGHVRGKIAITID